jgi:hypothetical protein
MPRQAYIHDRRWSSYGQAGSNILGLDLIVKMPGKPKPKVLLFDIGGVCVVSPFKAILEYVSPSHPNPIHPERSPCQSETKS